MRFPIVAICCCLHNPLTLASGRQCGACVGAGEEKMCVVCGGCYKVGIVVMDVGWRQLA